MWLNFTSEWWRREVRAERRKLGELSPFFTFFNFFLQSILSPFFNYLSLICSSYNHFFFLFFPPLSFPPNHHFACSCFNFTALPSILCDWTWKIWDFPPLPLLISPLPWISLKTAACLVSCPPKHSQNLPTIGILFYMLQIFDFLLILILFCFILIIF